MDKIIEHATKEESTEFIAMAKGILTEKFKVVKHAIVVGISEGVGGNIVINPMGGFGSHMDDMGYKKDKDYSVDGDRYKTDDDEIAEKMDKFFKGKKVKYVREGNTFIVKPDEKIEEEFMMDFPPYKKGKDYFMSAKVITANNLEVSNGIEDQLKAKNIPYTASRQTITII